MAIVRVCGWCGQEVSMVPAKVRPTNFCSRQCSGKFRQGKPFHTNESRQQIAQALAGRSNPAAAQRLKGMRGEKHPRWKGNAITEHGGRKRAQAMYPSRPCEICGVKPDAVRIHRHHKDENTRNNAPDNIQFLCTKHHREAHRMITGGVI